MTTNTKSNDDGRPNTARKYVPQAEGLNLEFHRACVSTGLLHLQRCTACGLHRHPPRWYCPQCHSKEAEFVPVSGEGTLYSMAINHFAIDRAWIDEVPFITAVVELVEGPRVVGSMPGVAPDDVHLGMPVQVIVEPRGEDFAFLRVDAVPSGDSD